MIGIREETGRLDEMLLKVAKTYEGNLQNSVKQFVALLEPTIILIMLIVRLVIGLIVTSILLAIFSINEIPLPIASGLEWHRFRHPHPILWKKEKRSISERKKFFRSPSSVPGPSLTPVPVPIPALMG